MVHYRLNYFNFRGRGETLRLIFAAANHSFEDNRFELTHWHEYKPRAPFGKAPWLEIYEHDHEIVLSQAPTIARYLARKFHLAGKSEIETAELEMHADQLWDLLTEIIECNLEPEVHRKKILHEKLVHKSIPDNLKICEDRLLKVGSGYFAASGLSWVDLHLVAILDFIPDKEDVLADYKKIRHLDETVRGLPHVAAWIEKRPHTTF